MCACVCVLMYYKKENTSIAITVKSCFSAWIKSRHNYHITKWRTRRRSRRRRRVQFSQCRYENTCFWKLRCLIYPSTSASSTSTFFVSSPLFYSPLPLVFVSLRFIHQFFVNNFSSKAFFLSVKKIFYFTKLSLPLFLSRSTLSLPFVS